jgi:fermentation-respiration switch protein FrsA (DUF1100 family)
MWNYRGYYRSTGSPTPDNLKYDGEQVLSYMRNNLNLKGKLGVHGESMGGLIACHLAS